MCGCCGRFMVVVFVAISFISSVGDLVQHKYCMLVGYMSIVCVRLGRYVYVYIKCAGAMIVDRWCFNFRCAINRSTNPAGCRLCIYVYCSNRISKKKLQRVIYDLVKLTSIMGEHSNFSIRSICECMYMCCIFFLLSVNK